ncbi:MAG: mechanosensitive ion channel [Pseudomonadota bacterium]|nr:mechanosensitive ion channel [Pseudomonadota bacterium]
MPLHRLLSTALLLLALAVGLPAQAQTVVTPAQLDSARSALAETALTDAQRTQATEALDAAAAALRLAEAQRQQAQALPPATPPETTASAAPRAGALAAGAAWAEWRASVPEGASTATLEALLAHERQESTELRRRIDQRAAELAEVIAQPRRVADTLVALRRRAAELAVPASASADQPAALQDALALRRRAEAAALQAEIALREREQETAGSRQAAIETDLQVLRRQLAQSEPRQAWLGQRIVQGSLGQLEQQAAQLEAQLGAQMNAQMNAQMDDHLAGQPATPRRQDPATAATLARTNAQLARQLVTDTVQLASEREQLADDERTSERIATVLRDARTRLTVGGNSAAIGQWLWRQRVATPAALPLELQRRDVQARLSELRMRQYTLADQRQHVWQAETEAGAEADANTSLRAQQQRLLEQASALLAQRVAVLEQSDRQLTTMIESGGELRRLMNQELLWVPSHAPMNAAWLAALPSELGPRAIAPRIADIGRLLWRDLQARPLAWALLGLLAGLWGLRRHAMRQSRQLAAHTRDVLQDRFGYTAQAFVWAVASAIPWPVTLWSVGTLVQELGAGRLADAQALGQALLVLAWLTLPLSLLRALIAPDGLAEAHLHWPASRLRHLRRAWWIACWVLLPATLFGMWALARDSDAAAGIQARVAIIVIGVGMGALLAWLLRREAPFPSTPGALRHALAIALPAAFMGVALMAVAGYVYSSTIVLNALLNSLVVIVMVQMLHGLAIRWVLLGERQLALRQWQTEHAGPDAVDAKTGLAAPLPDTAALALVQVAAQTRRLLGIARIALLLVGLALAWSDVMPALSRLDALALWQFAEKDAAGQPVQGSVTVAALLTALALLLLGLSLARNIPGLVELLLSGRAGFTASVRYTFATLLRYGVVIVCTLTALSLLGLRWSQMQWMAAALTVGLGFGLQEIFANFVSGLILLVERPFRVGDTITVNQITGTVTRIRTRATVVQDFDNKEVIIPNKTFITDQVVNWTLSDEVTRLILPVSVAYGSPVPRVHALLQQAATEVPGVLAEPPLRTWFMAFGARTLDFELRVFVASMGERLAVQNALLQRIDELFAAEGIQIARPFTDVRLHRVPARPDDQRGPVGPQQGSRA